MMQFDEDDFQGWVRDKASFSLRTHWNYDAWGTDGLEEAEDELMAGLTPMELVCYLGEYLTSINATGEDDG